LKQEDSNESWAALQNLIMTRPQNFTYSAIGMSLVKCLIKEINFNMLKDLVQHDINVNEVYVANKQRNPLGICFEMKRYEYAAYLIYHKAVLHESFATLPPIISLTHLIIQTGKVKLLKFNLFLKLTLLYFVKKTF